MEYTPEPYTRRPEDAREPPQGFAHRLTKKRAPKTALPEDKGPGTRPNRLTRKPKKAFIVPIHKTLLPGKK